jgi:hypothetical protein
MLNCTVHNTVMASRRGTQDREVWIGIRHVQFYDDKLELRYITKGAQKAQHNSVAYW